MCRKGCQRSLQSFIGNILGSHALHCVTHSGCDKGHESGMHWRSFPDQILDAIVGGNAFFHGRHPGLGCAQFGFAGEQALAQICHIAGEVLNMRALAAKLAGKIL